jgi:O-acetyl-ADP-ribose deacetylase (regulator of RNase III)
VIEAMTELHIDDRVIRLIMGDITSLDIEAFVYDARPDLVLGAGYGGAISVRGGPKVQEELKQLGPVKVGEAVVSSAGKMKASYIIHAVGPRFQEEDEERKLHRATVSALRCAEERGITRVAFPALGAGFFGMPAERSARVMLGAVRERLKGPTTLREVVFCLLDSRQLRSFEAVLDALGPARAMGSDEDPR